MAHAPGSHGLKEMKGITSRELGAVSGHIALKGLSQNPLKMHVSFVGLSDPVDLLVIWRVSVVSQLF